MAGKWWLRLNAFHIVFSIFNVVKSHFLYIFSAANIKIHNRIVVADKYLTYKMIDKLFLVILVVYVAFQFIFYN